MSTLKWPAHKKVSSTSVACCTLSFPSVSTDRGESLDFFLQLLWHRGRIRRPCGLRAGLETLLAKWSLQVSTYSYSGHGHTLPSYHGHRFWQLMRVRNCFVHFGRRAVRRSSALFTTVATVLRLPWVMAHSISVFRDETWRIWQLPRVLFSFLESLPIL
jgi:hypothetical protein